MEMEDELMQGVRFRGTDGNAHRRLSSNGNLSVDSRISPSTIIDPVQRQSQQKVPGKSPHQCHLCARSYERVDHLNRHLKTHENARPHKCSQCPKRFNRADLLTRHEASHNKGPSRRADEGERVSVACRACVISKCKCQDEKPCARCRTKGIVCEAVPGRARAGSLANFHGTQSSDIPIGNSASFSESNSNLSQDNDSQANPSSRSPALIGNNVSNEGGSIQMQFTSTNGNAYETVEGQLCMSSNELQMQNPAFQQLSAFQGEYQFGQELGFIPRASYFGQDLDFDVWEMDHPDFEFHTLMEPPPSHQQPSKQTHDEQPGRGTHASKRHAAFKRSPWLWNPTKNDHALNDRTNLDVDHEGIMLAASPSTPGTQMDQFSNCCIESTMRDKILQVLFNVRVGDKPISTFPPLNFLNFVIQVFFAQSRFNSDDIIHSATFNPKSAPPELLIAIISAGAAAMSSPSVWKMGLALQEIIRHVVAELWERNNTNTRNIQTLQAWLIGIETGLWSGVKRKMEIAESLLLPIIMMMRRGGVFAMGKGSPDLVPSLDDSIADLEAKWAKFVDRETFKRLALRLFVHDVEASAGFQKPPQISVTEFDIDLPVSLDLWLAETAVQWRDEYLRKEWIETPTLLEAMQEPEKLHRVAGLIDTKLCSMAIVGGYWGQVWRLIEARKFYPSSRAAYRLSLMTEKDELYRGLVTAAVSVSSLCRNDPPVVLFSEFFLMVSHISPEDVQHFAGKSGPEKSRIAHESFQTWSHTSESREAVWHAGQVLRAAKLLMPMQLKDFNAVAVYYASLTIWIYGLMLSLRNENKQNGFHDTYNSYNRLDQDRYILLNDTETENVKNFLTLGKGTPGLAQIIEDNQSFQFLPITAAEKVLQLARDLYRNNFSHITNEPLPPLVESLGSLMHDLGNSLESRASRMATEVPE